ncbi:MAG: CsbD family protein [Alphaproteobacteria bacterium]|nr:CsbD family protein [Alphaproteobacteria bacterium]
MNTDIIEGKWNEIKGAVQEKWGKLTDDDIAQIDGNRTKLLGAVQKNYGIARDEAEKQLKDWEDSFDA